MKLALATVDCNNVDGYTPLMYDDALKQLDAFKDSFKNDFSHSKLIKTGDSTGPFAVFETSSVKDLLKFEAMHHCRVEENPYSKQVPYVLIMQ